VIVEERIYTLQPGKTGEYFKLYEEFGLPVRLPILGNLIGYFATEFGPLNQVIHMWGYNSLDERMKRRAELFKSEAWHAYLAKSRQNIVHQENKILIPAPFSPIGGIR